jgi:hypothetical protein
MTKKSKIIFRNITAVTVMFIIVFLLFLIQQIQPMPPMDVKAEPTLTTTPKTTGLEITNTSRTDTVLVYLTLNSTSKFVNNVNGIFGITSTDTLQGNFYLDPLKTVSYTSTKPLSGNVSFHQPPTNCPYIGTTLYEFTLNNAGTVSKAQETVDISCVAGVSSRGQILLTKGAEWTDNVDKTPIKTIENLSLYHNTGISGVFPFGCTNCINTKGTPKCKATPTFATPNTKNLCNVQRSADSSGGIVRITYIEEVSSND